MPITVQEFVDKHEITMTCERINRRSGIGDGWDASASHWRCKLLRNQLDMNTEYSMGSAHKNAPLLVDVLDCIAMDSAGIENARGFEDWCGEYGYDTDSRKAERIYNACLSQYEQLTYWLGSELAQELMFETERE